MEIKVVNSIQLSSGEGWENSHLNILERKNKSVIDHSYLISFEGGFEIGLSFHSSEAEEFSKECRWQKLFLIEDLQHAPHNNRDRDEYYCYSLNTHFRFGKYRGSELGTIYMTDPQYVEWCIKEIPEFRIHELTDLFRFGQITETVMNHSLAVNNDINPQLFVFPCIKNWSAQQIAGRIKYVSRSYKVSQEIIALNERKLKQI